MYSKLSLFKTSINIIMYYAHTNGTENLNDNSVGKDKFMWQIFKQDFSNSSFSFWSQVGCLRRVSFIWQNKKLE